MLIPTKLPINLSQVKNETGQASMAHAAVMLGMAKLVGTDLQPDIKCSQFVGKGVGNYQAKVVAATDVLTHKPSGSYYLSGDEWDNTGELNIGGVGTTAISGKVVSAYLQVLGAHSSAHVNMYCYANGKTYQFNKPTQQYLPYEMTNVTAATELNNIMKANLNKIMKFRLTRA